MFLSARYVDNESDLEENEEEQSEDKILIGEVFWYHFRCNIHLITSVHTSSNEEHEDVGMYWFIVVSLNIIDIML